MTGAWLGIETTTPTGGVAVLRDGDVVVEEFFPLTAVHSEKLLPGIRRITEKAGVEGAGIDGVAVSAGPGSYTGLRIGIATALGLARGWSVEVTAVNTLRMLAYPPDCAGPVLVAVAARKGEVFAGVYSSSSPDSVTIVEPGVYTVAAVENRIASIRGLTAVGCGSAILSLPEDAVRSGPDFDSPRPSVAALLGSLGFGSRGPAEPVYLRGFRERAGTNVR